MSVLFKDHGQGIVPHYSHFPVNTPGSRPVGRLAPLLDCGPSALLGHMYITRKVERAGAEGDRSASNSSALNRLLRSHLRVESRRLFISILQYSCYYNYSVISVAMFSFVSFCRC